MRCLLPLLLCAACAPAQEPVSEGPSPIADLLPPPFVESQLFDLDEIVSVRLVDHFTRAASVTLVEPAQLEQVAALFGAPYPPLDPSEPGFWPIIGIREFEVVWLDKAGVEDTYITGGGWENAKHGSGRMKLGHEVAMRRWIGSLEARNAANAQGSLMIDRPSGNSPR